MVRAQSSAEAEIVLSMKASNPKVMIEAYRLLVVAACNFWIGTPAEIAAAVLLWYRAAV